MSEPRTVLVVDPDEAFGQVLQPLLGSDYLLLQESSISEAIAGFSAAVPDAILLNLDAAGQEQNTSLLRAANERNAPLPVIAYSWEPVGPKVLNAFREGAFDTISQPLDRKSVV